jgi:hypothetical protein
MFYVYWMSIAYYIALSMSSFAFLYRCKEWVANHQTNLLFLVGILLVGALAFEGGLLRGKLTPAAPLVISLPALPEAAAASSETLALEQQGTAGERAALQATAQPTGTCVFVGSKNSNKYHLSTCAVAKRIKAENKICFASKEEAEKRGYIPSCMK